MHARARVMSVFYRSHFSRISHQGSRPLTQWQILDTFPLAHGLWIKLIQYRAWESQ